MKMANQEPLGRFIDTVAFPRNGGDIGIKFTQLDSEWEIFNELKKIPTPPKVIKPGVGEVADVDNKGYLQQINNFTKFKVDFMVIASITQVNEIEWDNVDLRDPKTWANWRNEMREWGLTLPETNVLENKVFELNSLNERLLEASKKRFLSLQSQQAEAEAEAE